MRITCFSKKDIFTQISKFIKVNAIPKSTFGRMVMNDPKLIDDLMAGRDMSISTLEKISKFMDSYQARP